MSVPSAIVAMVSDAPCCPNRVWSAIGSNDASQNQSKSTERGRQVFDALPVRLGTPQPREVVLPSALQKPAFATAVGLALYGVQLFPETDSPIAPTRLWKQLVQTVRRWFQRH